MQVDALPAGLATGAKQDTGNTSLASIDGKITAVNTGAVTISAALPAGTNNIGDVDVLTLPAVTIAAAQTLATVTTVGTVTTVTGITNPVAVTGTFFQATQPVSVAATLTVTGTGGTFPVTDSGGSLTVDAPVATPVFVRLSDGSAAIATLPVSLASVPTHGVAGDVAHDAADSGNPLKLGGKVSTATPTPVAAADRVDAYFDQYGRLVVSDRDVETGLTIGTTGLRDRLTAQRYTVIADSLADGLAGFWTSTTANGGTTTSSGGEGLIQTSAGATGSAQLSSTAVAYFPGQVGWFNSAVRFNDTGSANNTRRIGVFTVSGTTPQDGFYYELSGTTLNAVVCKAGTPTAVASTAWSEFAISPFTLDTNYHSFEIRYTANTVWFYVDNVLRHRVSGTTASITATLNFPITIHSINTSGASNRLIAVRNVGIGRFGCPEQPVAETGLSAVHAIAVGGGTPHDSVDSGNPLKIGGYAKTLPPTAAADADRVNAWFTQTGALNVVPQPHAGGGLSVFRSLDLDETEEDVKTSAGCLYKLRITNRATTPVYVKIYNATAANVTVGSTTPIDTIEVPGNATDHTVLTENFGGLGLTFDTALSLAATTGFADADTGAPATNACIVSAYYK